ncbi:MAG: amidohydrolase [Candidatus Viridilinea halotolerans]|uniref:Amidohydrolase n=1 Tax=Candidatus Viridilinea halotolerans TaxID=2491704 RepID=A0A426TRY6_9CHLR|nr:MAG: amidohydrolase [Candidatus Viridilinea halotolerans]
MSTLVFYNGPIYTLNAEQPVVRALAVRDGRIVALGSEGRVQASVAGQRGEPINLRGRALVPGLTDAHVHIIQQGLTLYEVHLAGVTSLKEAQKLIAERSAQLPAGTWLRGGGWNHSAWGQSWPTRADLDAVCADRPVILTRKDGHSLWVNSRALSLAGITATTPHPEGGQIQRDRNGQPTGILIEAAMDLVLAVVPPLTEEERLAALRAALREALSYGLTSFHVVPLPNHASGPEVLRDLQTLRTRGELSLRALVYFAPPDLEGVIHMGLRSGFGDHWLRLGGLKLFADGSLGSESAEMLSHYEGRRHTGMATLEPEVLDATIRRANLHGISVAVHAIGDAANRKVLNAMERAAADRAALGDAAPPLALPNRIEHVQVIHAKDLPRLAALGIIASMQPIHCTSDIEAAEALWGERCANAYAWRSLHESGATLAFGSDAPVESMNPWFGLHAAVTRQRPNGWPEHGWYPEECLSVEDAMRAYCIGPAIASAEADCKGQLRIGNLADFAVLTGDPFRSQPYELPALTAAMTVVGGKVVFER